MDRLITADLAAGMGYAYDANGNRTSATVNGTSTTYNYVAGSHRLSSLTGGTSRSFSYDAAGNTTSALGITFTYDGRGRMKQAGSTTYLVNGLGQRVKKSNAAGDIYFAYVNGNSLSRADPLGLFEIIFPPGHEPANFPEAVKHNKRIAQYRATLQVYADEFQTKIRRSCVTDGARLQRIFDSWKVWIDPYIDDPVRRAKENYAVTRYHGPTTQFNWAFFNRNQSDPSGSFIFAHEFRHLMEENYRLYRFGDEFRDRSLQAAEIDADRWASTCGCEATK